MSSPIQLNAEWTFHKPRQYLSIETQSNHLIKLINTKWPYIWETDQQNMNKKWPIYIASILIQDIYNKDPKIRFTYSSCKFSRFEYIKFKLHNDVSIKSLFLPLVKQNHTSCEFFVFNLWKFRSVRLGSLLTCTSLNPIILRAIEKRWRWTMLKGNP